MAEVRLDGVFKYYEDVLAVDDVNLTMKDGDFVALLGPSGCGKTTTLNLIAGLIEISDGEIWIGDRDVTDLDPKDRDIAMVFQNYALYPTKTVYNNLAFPLQMRKTPKDKIDERVRRTAEMLSISHLLERRPRELSGGQQQRVALGRALVRDPRVFLMDEPLSNLDAKLRVQMRAELKRFHQTLHATMIYVTHDQLEAMTMADNIAVMNEGRVQQYGPPEEIFYDPANLFVAGFIGSPAMNFLYGDVEVQDGVTSVKGDAGWSYPLTPENAQKASHSTNGRIIIGARPANLILSREEQPGLIPGQIYTVEPTGDATFVHITIGEQIYVAVTDPFFRAEPDDPIWIDLEDERIHLFDEETEEVLRSDGLNSRSVHGRAVVQPA
jgi:multiple sugar transport system ATP-binding protein